MLGSGSNSRLYRTLVVDKGIALNAGASYASTALDYAKFGVYGVPKPGVTLPQVEDGIDAVLAEVVEQGVTADELDSAKNRLIADAVYAQDNQATLARWYGAAIDRRNRRHGPAWPDRIRAVTAEAVQAAARQWLDSRRSVTGYLVQDQPEARGEAFVNAIARALSKPVHRAAVAIAIPLLAAVTSAAPASATTIERVVSPSGIEAWLVREPAVPLVALDFAFSGGAAQDPAGKAGTANLAASTLDEGAGDFDSKTFHERLENKAIELNFSADRDDLRGSLRTLTENRDEAFDDLRLSLTAPRFDRRRRARARADSLALRRATTSPTDIASQRWWDTAFPGHPYGRPARARWKRCRASPSPT